jgi:hypothetical protein
VTVVAAESTATQVKSSLPTPRNMETSTVLEAVAESVLAAVIAIVRGSPK